jgi:hypothetical protein
VLGAIYLVAVLLGGIGGFVMGTRAFGGIVSQIGFCLLAVCWIGTGAMAVRAIAKRRIDEHRAWMIRNYALPC